MTEQKTKAEATRRLIKGKKPDFKRHDSHKKGRIKENWRKGRGLQSKSRLNKRGYVRRPSKGWKSPQEVRGLTRELMQKVSVSRKEDLAKIDVKTQVAEIASSVGVGKRLEIIEEAVKNNIIIINYKDIQKEAEKLKADFEKRKQQTKKAKQNKEKKAKDREKKAEEKKKEEEKEGLAEKVESEEDKKDKEKKELDKVLTQKE